MPRKKLHPLLAHLRRTGHSYRTAAAELKCHFTNVGNICRGTQMPKPELAWRIVAWSGGKISFAELYR